MRLLTDESFPLASLSPLRAAGHDVVAVAHHLPGASHPRVLLMARWQRRLLLTFDPQYAALVYDTGARPPLASIYLAFAPVTPQEPAERLAVALAEGPWTRSYIVVERDTVIRRPLPPVTRRRPVPVRRGLRRL